MIMKKMSQNVVVRNVVDKNRRNRVTHRTRGSEWKHAILKHVSELTPRPHKALHFDVLQKENIRLFHPICFATVVKQIRSRYLPMFYLEVHADTRVWPKGFFVDLFLNTTKPLVCFFFSPTWNWRKTLWLWRNVAKIGKSLLTARLETREGSRWATNTVSSKWVVSFSSLVSLHQFLIVNFIGGGHLVRLYLISRTQPLAPKW